MLAAKLHKYDLEKGITLARQSNAKRVLANIKRGNIKQDSFAALQRRFNDLDVPIYTEMILGLPGESYETWRDGIQQILQSGLKNQLFVYQCEVYPNTEMSDPEYQRQHEIKTKKIGLREIHGSVRDECWVQEFQDIVISTNTMSTKDWRRMTRFSVLTMLLHSMKLGFYVFGWLADRFGTKHVEFIEFLNDEAMFGKIISEELQTLDRYIEDILEGGGRGCVVPGYLDIYWDIEEAIFIRLSQQLEGFFKEFGTIVKTYLTNNGILFDPKELAEVLCYQNLRIPTAISKSTVKDFTFNIPEYFDHLFTTNPIKLIHEPQSLTTVPMDYRGSTERFVIETILRGRKSGTLEVNCNWQSNVHKKISSETVKRERKMRAEKILRT